MISKDILLKFCTGVQIDNVNAYFDNGCNYHAAGRAVGKSHKVIERSIKRAARRAADHGHIDNLPKLEIAEGRKLGKVTTQINEHGEVKNVWYRQDDYHEQSLLAIDEYCKELPRSVSKKPRGLKLFDQAGLEGNLRFARHHHDIIKTYGRFPHRNEALGRVSSQAELDYLNSKEAFTG